jgi:cation diffusion facilitator family transporter
VQQAVAAEGDTKAVITALAANLGIAVSKFVAALITGSSSMFAEAVHSVADSTNQALLLIGGRRAHRAPDARHPFGHGRERYIYAFIVSIVLFTLGGLYALYEGYQKIRHPHELTSPAVAVVVLLVAVALEGYALRTAARIANRTRGVNSWWAFIRHAKAPEIPTILLEDAGAVLGLSLALLGVGLTTLTGNATFDALATVGIGALLVTIAAVLAIEIKSLLVGESASKDDVERIRRALEAEPLFDRVIYIRTMHLGPDEILVTAKVTVSQEDDGAEISQAINRAEARIREVVPNARYIVIEPDLDQTIPSSRTAT